MARLSSARRGCSFSAGDAGRYAATFSPICWRSVNEARQYNIALDLNRRIAPILFTEQDRKTASVESNYKRVNGFSGYLNLDDYPLDHVQRRLDPSEIVTLSAMPTMKRGETMGAFVELMGCKRNTRGACNARVNYTIYKPDNSILAARAVREREILWKKQT